MLSALLVSAALAFTEADADFAYACASNFVEKCTPRDAGTGGGHIAANWILDTASKTGADVRRDKFRAMARVNGKDVERTFVNLYATFKGSRVQVEAGTSGISPEGKVRAAKQALAACGQGNLSDSAVQPPTSNLQPVPQPQTSNLKPQTPWVVFVSHYDTKPGKDCPGANDGASTTGLLIALAAALSDRGYEGSANVMLLWLDGEECVSAYGKNDGLWGSKRAAEEFQRREMDVKAVVCLDMLGDRNLDITMPFNGTPTLMKVVKEAAKAAGVEVACSEKVMRDDHIAFLETGYSSVDLIDFNYGSAPGKNDWWHTPQDTADKISCESLLKSGRLVAELINTLAK